MKSFMLFLKGIAIGIGNMIAGISGGTIAFILGIYEEMLTAFANITKKFWPNFLYLLKVGLGIIVGLVLTAKLLNILFQILLLETVSLFVGVVVGGLMNDIPALKLTEEEKSHKPHKYIIAMIIACVIVIGLSVLNIVISKGGASPTERYTDVKIKDMILLFVMIIPGTMCMLFPGISGSLLFMILGIYYPVLNMINDFIHFNNWADTQFVLNSLKVVIPLLLGAAVALLFVSKPIKWLFNKFHKICLYVIVGFVIGSVFAMYIVNYKEISLQFTWWHLVFSLLFTLPGGMLLSISLNKMGAKMKAKEEAKLALQNEEKEANA